MGIMAVQWLLLVSCMDDSMQPNQRSVCFARMNAILRHAKQPGGARGDLAFSDLGLTDAQGRDVWGRPMKFSINDKGQLEIVSSGDDGQLGTADDLFVFGNTARQAPDAPSPR